MPKGYWVASFRSISNPQALEAYARLSRAAIEAGGGRFLARGTPTQTCGARLRGAGANQHEAGAHTLMIVGHGDNG